MEIRVEKVIRGRALRDEILERYGGRPKLASLLESHPSPQVRSDAVTLRHLDEDPERLDLEWTVTDIHLLSHEDVEQLTKKRLQILDELEEAGPDLNVSSLARQLGRDKKNISRDLQILSRMGLVRLERRGREASPRLEGNEIRIVFASTPKRRRGRRPGVRRSQSQLGSSRGGSRG